MIVLDTCILIFDALTPQKLSSHAKKSILQAEKKNLLYCCDISLWEIAMLIQKKRIDPGIETKSFLDLILRAREIQVLSINSDIAALSTTLFSHKQHDPANRLIAATTIYHNAILVTSDEYLRKVKTLSTIW